MEVVHLPLVNLPHYGGSAKNNLYLWLSLCLRQLIPSGESISMDVFNGWVSICLVDTTMTNIVSLSLQCVFANTDVLSSISEEFLVCQDAY